MNDPGIEVRTYFARHRNALVARADFSELFAAWYLHRMDCGIVLPHEHDQFGRECLAALTLHGAGRPWKESSAWTVHFASPCMNIFAANDNQKRTVVANVFTENVKEIPHGMFYADVIEEGASSRRSVVEFKTGNFLQAVEQFYSQSEQRTVRFFWKEEEDLVMVAAQPDCDLDWLNTLDHQQIESLDKDVELSLLEIRHYRFECGCTNERMLDLLAPVFRRQADELFGEDEIIRIHCPRCGARHIVTRESLEARIT